MSNAYGTPPPNGTAEAWAIVAAGLVLYWGSCALLSPLCLALSPSEITLSQEVRFYTSQVLALLLGGIGVHALLARLKETGPDAVPPPARASLDDRIVDRLLPVPEPPDP